MTNPPGKADRNRLDRGSCIAEIYQTGRIVEAHQCGYAVNPEYLPLSANSEFKFCARDDNGNPHSFELNANRFFSGTVYQPEPSSLQQITHPLITAFVMASLDPS